MCAWLCSVLVTQGSDAGPGGTGKPGEAPGATGSWPLCPPGAAMQPGWKVCERGWDEGPLWADTPLYTYPVFSAPRAELGQRGQTGPTRTSSRGRMVRGPTAATPGGSASSPNPRKQERPVLRVMSSLGASEPFTWLCPSQVPPSRARSHLLLEDSFLAMLSSGRWEPRHICGTLSPMQTPPGTGGIPASWHPGPGPG